MRRKILAMSLALVLLIGIGAGACGGGEVTPPPGEEEEEAAPPEIVTFADANLEAAIRGTINKPQGAIYTSDLESLTRLEAPAGDISNLTGLEYCVNLESIRLENNNISDISPLVENSGLDAGDQVSLQNNDLDLSEGSEDMENIRALEDRGVIVQY
jgi:Leucine-rich repeat (LRR) protein